MMGGDGAEAASVPFHDLAAEGEPVADRVRSRAFPAFLVGLLALNLLISFLTGGLRSAGRCRTSPSSLTRQPSDHGGGPRHWQSRYEEAGRSRRGLSIASITVRCLGSTASTALKGIDRRRPRNTLRRRITISSGWSACCS